jgi:hypothetical protein
VVAGLPGRWGRVAYDRLSSGWEAVEKTAAILKKAQARAGRVGPDREEEAHGRAAERYKTLATMLDTITSAPIPVDATDASLCVLAERYASDCAGIPLAEFATYAAHGPSQLKTPRDRLADICRLRGIEPPTCEDDGEAVNRMMDPAWWRLGLRRAHGRAFEHAAMLLGFVSVKTGSYCSDETVARRRQQNERNAAALKGAMLRNEKGQEFSLYDLAQKGMANKSNRKGELMLRMAGCEEVAREYGHVGLFVTGTCPSKFHAVLHGTGEFNPKYADAGSPTPRQAQKWLNTAWVRTRAQNDRDGVAPYGFRIAEPHHDGTPHWHMLLFMPRNQVETFKRNMSIHWLAEDGNEPGAITNRVKFVEIDPAKGTAAGYIAKYVGKNIDDSQGEAFDEEGKAIVNDATTACERVDAWASVWGIRQFQGLGMPPVTVWRELRRVKEDNEAAPDYVQRALMASRRIEGQGPTVDGKPLVLHAADFAEYIRAQGGIHMGRDYLVRIAAVEGLVKAGRYGVIIAAEPYGVYGATAPEVVCESMRFTWTRAGRKSPRSPLNNCTQHPAQPVADPAWWEGIGEPIGDFDPAESFAEVEAAGLWFTEDEIFWGMATAGAEAWANKAEFLEGRGEDASAAWARCAEYLEVMAHGY